MKSRIYPIFAARNFINQFIRILNRIFSKTIILSNSKNFFCWTKKTIVAACALFATSLLSAQNPGDLDPTFGNNGKVTTEIGSASFLVDIIDEMAVQSDGKIIAAGSSRASDLSKQYTLARYNVDGSLDNTFGNNGVVILPTDVRQGFIRTVEILADGKILAGAQAYDPNTGSTLVLFRLLGDGSLDPTFGNGGKVSTNFYMVAMDMKIQQDGKILIVGDYQEKMTIIRFNADGSIDASYADSGYRVLDMDGVNSSARSLAIQADNKAVIAGFFDRYYEDLGGALNKWVVVRVNEDGTLDDTFGAGGYLTMSIGDGPDFSSAVGIQNNGKIIVGGHTWVSNEPFKYSFAIVRLNTDGSLDDSFGTDGMFIGEFLPDDQNYINDIVVAPSDNIYASFFVSVYDGVLVDEESCDMGVFCLTADGQLRESFGENGYSRIKINDMKNEATDLVMQPDGKVLISGEAYSVDGTPFAMARFITGEESGPSGIVSNEEGSISLYPNPTTENIYISCENEHFTVQLFEVASGRLVMSENDARTINVSQLPAGTYIIKLVSDGKVLVDKFIKL